MALYHFSAKILSHSTRNTVGAVAYRAGCQLSDLKTGESFDYENKAVQHVELLVPKDAPQWVRDIQGLINEDRQKGVQALSEKVEAAEYRINSQVWREVEVALHRELTNEQNISLTREFVEDQLCGRGMTALLNFHFDVDKITGESKPHCHILLTMRTLEETDFNSKKERSWNTKAVIQELREQWAQYSNFHLKLHGHDIQIDHRSNKERGIEMEPQPKQGKNVLELEKKAKSERIEGANRGPSPQEKDNPESASVLLSPVTDKAKAFHEVHLRNLYRVLRYPEVIFEIVTKHHSTFMWADVQKKLHQYVDEAPLFERLEAKLKNSRELILLRVGEIENTENSVQDKAIYTTRSLLKAERVLVKSAEDLGQYTSHGVEAHSIKDAIAKANEELKKHGGLSQDQVKAIHHLVEAGQLKCMVGIAGAGKTTALGVCHEIWKNSGYGVYGLAPTGKASQNLDQNGIPSTTLHKFLKSFEEGRCQYTQNSILVLDEAGMVDIERFSGLLSTVKQLGVKLIVVGDGAQLQPVEAGPAFRLVTERLGKSELNTVIRQKKKWQKEATVLFGTQKTEEAIKKYAAKDCVHITNEKLPDSKEALAKKDYEGLVKIYEVSSRVSSLMYREMIKDVKKDHPHLSNPYSVIKGHQDFKTYRGWKEREKEAATLILHTSEAYRPILERRSLDTFKMAMLLGDRKKEKVTQHAEARAFLKKNELDHLIGVEKQKGQGVDVRQETKEALIKEWHRTFKDAPEKSSLMLAYSNKDVNDLNCSARSLLKKSGHLSRQDFTYITKKEVEDDFGRKAILKEEKEFSKGDRIVFTRNTYGLGVKNGSMGTITELNNKKVHVKLDEGKEVSFSPNLNAYFAQGWAVTIHKSQGTTVDRTHVLASYEMSQNLAYVSMTRHQEWVKVFGSSLDFWRPEKLPQVLSKSGEKLSAADYLDAASLEKLMQTDDRLLTKIFDRIASELDAMGTVSKKAFWQAADHFLGINREKEMRMVSESIREEVRAEVLFDQKKNPQDISNPLQKTLEVQNQHRSFGVKTESGLKQNMSTFANNTFSSLSKSYNHTSSSVMEPQYEKKEPLSVNLQNISNPVQKTLGVQNQYPLFNAKAEPLIKQNTSTFVNDSFSSTRESYDKASFPVTERQHEKKDHLSVILQDISSPFQKTSRVQNREPHFDAKIVENAIKQNMSAFADDVFSSLGEDCDRASSSAMERRYGKKGHISVNLKTGAWIDYKDSEMSGGPLHMLTKLKGLSFKEAIDYGASWAGLSQAEGPHLRLSQEKQQKLISQEPKEEDLEKDQKVRIQKAKALWDKGRPIQGSLAERYLREHRKIEGNLPSDLRYLPHFKVYSRENGESEDRSEQSYPCLMAVARSPQGEITAIQLTFLNSETATKADLPVAKRSFGVLKRSAVTLQEEKDSNVLFVAEGVETALSLKEAGVKGTIKATLGLSNIKRLTPEDPFNGSSLNGNLTQIVVCADHDPPDSPATRSLQKSVLDLQSKGFSITVVKPEKLNEDFNDVLKEKGPQWVKEILAKNLPKNLLNSLQQDTEKRPPRDSFEKKDQKHSVRSPQEFTLAGKSFEEIAVHCEKRLHDSLARDKEPLTPERLQRFPLQAEKTADFLVHRYELNGCNPTSTELVQFSLRAKYELTRIPEIRKELIKDWKDKDSFKENEGLLAHMITERLASIEGRLYLKAKQDGPKIPSHIAELARQELKEHRVHTPKLAQELSQEYSLSKDAATHCAKYILRYKETHGDSPSKTQIAKIVQISKVLETRDYANISKRNLNHFEIDFFHRHEGDSLFRHISFQDQSLISANLLHIQDQAKKSLEATASQIAQELIKMNQKGFSL